MAIELEIEQRVEIADRLRHRAGEPLARDIGQRPVVLDQALKRFPGQVQPVELGVAPLQPGDDAQRLGVMVETAPFSHPGVQRVLARVAEGRVTEVVDQRNGLGEVLVAAQRPRQCAGDLRDFNRMGQAGSVVVALMGDEDLGLVLQPAEGGGVDDAVAVALEGGPRRAFGLRVEASARPRRIAGIGCARPVAEADVAESACLNHSRRRLTCPCPLHTYGGEANAR